jgi:hypothetical protein
VTDQTLSGQELDAEGDSARPPDRPIRVGPTDVRYPDLEVGADGRWVSSPDYVVLVNSRDQVVPAVQDAVRARLRVAVRSSGHCFEDFVDNADVRVIIDLSQLTEISFDAQRDAFAVEPGASLGDVYATLFKKWGGHRSGRYMSDGGGRRAHSRRRLRGGANGGGSAMFDEYLSGLGDRAIANGLNRDGILCPSANRRDQNRHRLADGWQGSTVRAILDNPRYTGIRSRAFGTVDQARPTRATAQVGVR